MYNYKLFNLLEKYTSNPSKIDDLNTYLVGMEKSLHDKMFFIDKIKSDLIVDFGCADGLILSELNKMNRFDLIGYDIDNTMIQKTKQRLNDNTVTVTNDWGIVREIVSEHTDPTILLLSVIHEVYSYSHAKKIKYFWENQVFNDKLKYVVIRDMMPSTEYEKFNMLDVKKIRSRSDQKYLADFEKEWGSIEDNFRVLLHWLLKYRYTENWSRELYEDYVPITIETLKTKIPFGWSIDYEEHYTLPFLKEVVKKDFDINLTENTHLKMIIRNNRF